MKKPLIVVSNLKQEVKAAAGFNTSAEVIDVLNELVRQKLAKAYESVKADHRKTLMARDLE